MDAIVVDKRRLLEIMKRNRENHAKIVEEAQAGFRTRVISRLDEMLAMAKKGKKIDINVGLQMPVDMTSEYDRARQQRDRGTGPIPIQELGSGRLGLVPPSPRLERLLQQASGRPALTPAASPSTTGTEFPVRGGAGLSHLP
jgi:hypothetical protein